MNSSSRRSYESFVRDDSRSPPSPPIDTHIHLLIFQQPLRCRATEPSNDSIVCFCTPTPRPFCSSNVRLVRALEPPIFFFVCSSYDSRNFAIFSFSFVDDHFATRSFRTLCFVRLYFQTISEFNSFWRKSSFQREKNDGRTVAVVPCCQSAISVADFSRVRK